MKWEPLSQVKLPAHDNQEREEGKNENQHKPTRAMSHRCLGRKIRGEKMGDERERHGGARLMNESQTWAKFLRRRQMVFI